MNFLDRIGEAGQFKIRYIGSLRGGSESVISVHTDRHEMILRHTPNGFIKASGPYKYVDLFNIKFFDDLPDEDES